MVDNRKQKSCINVWSLRIEKFSLLSDLPLKIYMFYHFLKRPSNDEVEQVSAEQAGKEAGLTTLSWIKRPSKYRDILNGAIDKLKMDYPG